MIDINLIPAAQRKSGQGDEKSPAINIPQEVLTGVGATVIFVVVTVHMILGLIWLFGVWQLSLRQDQWQKLSPDKAVLDAIYKDTTDLKKKFKMVSGITTAKSVLWAPKFNAVSDALPRGMWLRKMTLEKANLLMEGSVVSKTQNEINNLGLFLSALKQNSLFIKDFSSLEVNSIQRGNSNAIEVADFTVMAKLNEDRSK